ncbi:hypothetical protein [Chondromyces crocatus]|uniref:hypothetical protein n=1 Tax=Chondromyces crocatus TaxID=52 RepID=UPI0012E28BD9|nr:hypothetical protein [Chondromyces crocatus]
MSVLGVSLLGAALLWGCGGGNASGPPVSAAEYQGSEALNPKLPDGSVVYLSYDAHHPECFVFVGDAPVGGTEAKGERKTEDVACPDAALPLKACPAGLVYRSTSQADCICVPAGGDEAHRITCPH